MRLKTKPAVISAAISLSILSGCAQMETAYQKTSEFAKENKGAVIGSLSGAAVGLLACDGKPACIAATTVAGGALGYLWDKREKRLKALAKQESIAIETQRINTYNNSGVDNGFEIAVKNDGMFKSGSSQLTKKASEDFRKIASIYKEEPHKILVMGHTDATGSDSANQSLSESRARTVAKLFESEGVPSEYIYFQGSGETQPIADNTTNTGRSLNRRVEILEIDSEQSMIAYSLSKQANPLYLTHSTKTSKEIADAQTSLEKSKGAPKVVQPPASSDIVVAQAESDATPFNPVVDFGGQPALSDSYELFQSLGENEKKLVNISLFSEAHASAADALSPCYLDNPRSAGEIKSLDTGKSISSPTKYKTTDYYNGLYKTNWIQNVNGHLVALKEIEVLRDSGMAVGNPKLAIYENYYNGDKKSKADHLLPVTVNTYKGENGILLRMYYENSATDSVFDCADIVMPKKQGIPALNGAIYYGSNQTHTVTYTPSKI